MTGEGERDRLLLELVGGDRPPAELPRAGVLVLGSSAERAGFVFGGAGVADVHCAIGRTKGGGWAIRDLGSSAGTLVNGQKVDSVRLRPGDRIELGSRRLVVVDPDAVAATPPGGSSAAPTAPAKAHETQRIERIGAEGEAPGSARAAVDATGVARADAHGVPRAGATPPTPAIPGYKVEKLLGRGGMGLVWLAVQESLDRRVALKVLASKFEADAEFVRRFQAEARAAAALNHPNIVTVYDVGECRGTHYLSMEFMDSGNLEDRVSKEGRLAAREVLDVLRDAASGLVYAESRKIVHRDLKPANLMQNHVGATKIADLGLATHVEVEERESADKKVFGTPHFMSPEQARGERVDSRSDLYSLGATAYRLLTGHTPFEGATSRDILRAHLRDEPRPMRDFVPELSDDVVALVARLMQKDPAARFASATELLREIERLRAQAAAAAPAARGRGARSGGKVFAVLVLLALAAGGLWFARERASGGEPSAPFSSAPSEDGTGGAPDVTALDPVDAEPTSTEPATAPGEPALPEDDEQALELFEANARVAFLELAGRDIPPQEMRDELRLLALRFRGTSAATEAEARAQEIETGLVASAAVASARAEQVTTLSARLRAAALLDSDPPAPKAGLEAIRAIGGETGLATDPAFLAARKEVETAITQRASAHARAVLDETQRDLDAGRFDDADRKLSALMTVFELPDYPLGQGPAGVAELFELGRSARERLKNIEFMRGVFASKQAREDAAALAAGFGGSGGLEREIATLDLEGARARLEKLAASLGTPGTQAWVRDLAREVAGGQAMIDTLAREFGAGGWRRKGISDPREKKNVLRNAVGADAGGLLYEAEGGAVDRVPWAAYGGDAKELFKLFNERLAREYTPEEMRAVAGLLRISAVVEALDVVAKMFEPGKRANFTESNLRELQECFAPAQQWSTKAALPGAVAREVEAAGVLGISLARATEGAWSVAVASTERLLAEFEDTLLVRLLSDGTPATAPASAPSAEVGGADASKQ